MQGKRGRREREGERIGRMSAGEEREERRGKERG